MQSTNHQPLTHETVQVKELLEQLRYKVSHPSIVYDQMRVRIGEAEMRVFLSMLGGTLSGGIYLMIVYPLVSLSCKWGWFGAPAADGGIKIVQVVATMLAAALMAAFAFVAFRTWRHAQAEGESAESETEQALIPMLAFVSLLLNSLYFVIVLVSLVPVAALPACFQ